MGTDVCTSDGRVIPDIVRSTTSDIVWAFLAMVSSRNLEVCCLHVIQRGTTVLYTEGLKS